MLRWTWIFGLAALALLAGLGLYLTPLHPNIVALQFTFNQTAFQAVLDAWGPDGVALFRQHLPVDCVLLVCYGVFGYLLSTGTQLFAHVPPTVRSVASAMLPTAAGFDASENLCHWLLTGRRDLDSAEWYFLAGCSAMCKWILLLLFLAVVVWTVVRRSPHVQR